MRHSWRSEFAISPFAYDPIRALRTEQPGWSRHRQGCLKQLGGKAGGSHFLPLTSTPRTSCGLMLGSICVGIRRSLPRPEAMGGGRAAGGRPPARCWALSSSPRSCALPCGAHGRRSSACHIVPPRASCIAHGAPELLVVSRPVLCGIARRGAPAPRREADARRGPRRRCSTAAAKAHQHAPRSVRAKSRRACTRSGSAGERCSEPPGQRPTAAGSASCERRAPGRDVSGLRWPAPAPI